MGWQRRRVAGMLGARDQEGSMATVRYLVNDVAAAVAFYVDGLGFQVAQNFAPAMAILKRDDLTLWVAGPTASAARPMPARLPPHPPPPHPSPHSS